MSKPRFIKSYEKLAPELLTDILAAYPDGLENHSSSFTDHKGQIFQAVPYETEEFNYLIKLPKEEDLPVEPEIEEPEDDEEEPKRKNISLDEMSEEEEPMA